MIRHVIVFDSEAPREQVQAMAARAKRLMGAIAGVTDVRFGIALTPGARYQYFFDIGFRDESVIESYRHDPAHVRFADEEFRPLAPDRLTVDYRLE
jgi:fructose-bisphosphate aldolase class II